MTFDQDHHGGVYVVLIWFFGSFFFGFFCFGCGRGRGEIESEGHGAGGDANPH